ERTFEHPGTGGDPQKSPQGEPREANQLRSRERGFEPNPASLMLHRFWMIGIQHQVRVNEKHWCTEPSACSINSAALSKESPGRRFPKSRAVTLNGWRAATRRLANPRRSVSLTTSRNGRPARRDSAFSFAATSSSRVKVVRIS